MDSIETAIAKPFLRWAGGKKWLCKYIYEFIPVEYSNYHEIFLGSGSIFFKVCDSNERNYFLSDSNEDLINCYINLRDKIDDVIFTLRTFKNTEKFYYKIRGVQFSNDNIFRAARLLYLNKLGYNGIYRVNSKGEFNVPYGHRTNIDYVCEDNLRAVSIKLQKAILTTLDFDEALKKVEPNDLVFLDPPYTVAHENNGFIEYNQKIFSLADQIRLSRAISKIVNIGAYYILTNAKHRKILSIYAGLSKPIILGRHSHIGGVGARREEIKEYLFTNCKKDFR